MKRRDILKVGLTLAGGSVLASNVLAAVKTPSDALYDMKLLIGFLEPFYSNGVDLHMQ